MVRLPSFSLCVDMETEEEDLEFREVVFSDMVRRPFCRPHSVQISGFPVPSSGDSSSGLDDGRAVEAQALVFSYPPSPFDLHLAWR